MVSASPRDGSASAAARQPGLSDEIRAVHRLGIGQTKTKRFLHVFSQCF